LVGLATSPAFSRKITETPLAHVIGDKSEQALSPKRRIRETPEVDGCVARVLMSRDISAKLTARNSMAGSTTEPYVIFGQIFDLL
jgi:hypothetical protein